MCGDTPPTRRRKEIDFIMNKVTIGIIVALDLELENIENAMTEKSCVEISGMKFIMGVLSGKKIVAARCGVGKVFAAICTQTMILGFAPDVIVNVGVAGGLSGGLTIGEVFIAEHAVQHDMNTMALGDELGLISGLNMVYIPTDEKVTSVLEAVVQKIGINYEVGTIATGDAFINTNEMKTFLIETFSAAACDMESAAVVQTCYVNNVPCSVMRAISDSGDDNSHMDYLDFSKKAADTSAEVITEFVSQWN